MTQGDSNRQLEEHNVKIAGGNKVVPIEEPEVNGEETQGDNNVEFEKIVQRQRKRIMQSMKRMM